jgi:ATP-independent RNA helicase DbpA
MSTDPASLGLRPELLEAVEQAGYHELTPIQAAALPAMLAGQDVIGQAKTGSGKTAAFGLSVLQRLDPAVAATQALVLCPTRELAEQVATELRKLAKRLSHTRVQTLTGGRPIRVQLLSLAHGCQVVVGTPGRIGDHLRRGTLDLRGLTTLVLDEADRLLDMGFADEVQAIVEQCPQQRQTLLFSATLPDAIEALAAQVQRRPVRVGVASRVEPERLRQRVHTCAPANRWSTVADLLDLHRPEAALIFCETRDDCDALARFLSDRGASALALHGQMEQRDRDDILLQFSNGSARVLVATDVAARGLDIPALPMVIVAELSGDPESHVHRIGRTGRAGQSGLALSIVAGNHEQARLARIEAELGQPIERGATPPPSGDLTFLAPPNRTVVLLEGRRHKLRKGDVLGALVKDAGLPPEAIGSIALTDTSCSVAIARDHEGQARRFLATARIKNRRIRTIWLDGTA